MKIFLNLTGLIKIAMSSRSSRSSSPVYASYSKSEKNQIIKNMENALILNIGNLGPFYEATRKGMTVGNHTLTKASYNEYLGEIAKEIRALGAFSKKLYKTSRQGGNGAISKPVQLRPEFAEFFSQDLFGPEVLGSVARTATGGAEAKGKIVSSVTKNPLAAVLTFPHRRRGNSTNQLFAIAPTTLITGLISLHLFYSELAKHGSLEAMVEHLVDQKARGIENHFSATPEMRNQLLWLMELTIDKDAEKARAEGANQGQVDAAVNMAREALTNQKVHTSGPIEVATPGRKGAKKTREIFNANFFKFATATKLANNGKVVGAEALTLQPAAQAEIIRQSDLVVLAGQYKKNLEKPFEKVLRSKKKSA